MPLPKGSAPTKAALAPRSRSAHTKEPDWPKCPIVRAEASGAVQCGDFSPRISTPRPHGQGVKRPLPGTTPASAGNCESPARAAAARSPGSDGRAQHRKGSRRRRSQHPHERDYPGCPRSPFQAGQTPSGAPTERPPFHSPQPRPRRGYRSPHWSRCDASPGAATGRRPSKGRPEAWASRWRTVAPSGPAGSSREIRPRSTATSTDHATIGLVTDASGNARSTSPRE